MRYAYIIVVAAIVACSGEGQVSSDIPSNLDYESTAREFAQHLVAEKYESAFEMLSTQLQARISASDLRSEFGRMMEYGEGVPRVDDYVHKMEDWPDKGPSDIGWAYVSISGDNYVEAVTVIVSLEDGAMKIGEVEWGRA